MIWYDMIHYLTHVMIWYITWHICYDMIHYLTHMLWYDIPSLDIFHDIALHDNIITKWWLYIFCSTIVIMKLTSIPSMCTCAGSACSGNLNIINAILCITNLSKDIMFNCWNSVSVWASNYENLIILIFSVKD